VHKLPILVTLADQRVDELSFTKRMFLRLLLRRTDQVYGTESTQEVQIQETTRRTLPRHSLGEGDAFANALRFAYADIIRKDIDR
jgi:hypothetical protein